MNAFSLVIALGAIASASAGIIAPTTPLFSAYGAIAPHTFLTPLAPNFLVPNGHSLEGQYIPDNLEKLYDDGSYKPEIRNLPLVISPYGPVPAGSGLEGHYVPDNLERLYDDGSYKPDISEKLFDDGSYRSEAAVKLVHL